MPLVFVCIGVIFLFDLLLPSLAGLKLLQGIGDSMSRARVDFVAFLASFRGSKG
jgi:hypothetical protein